MANARAVKDFFAAIKDLDIDYAVIALQDLGNNIKSAIIANEVYRYLNDKNEELKDNKTALAVVTLARNLGLRIVLGPAGTVISLSITAVKVSQDPVTQEYLDKMKYAFNKTDPAKRNAAIYETFKDYIATKMGSEPAHKKHAAPVAPPPVPTRAHESEKKPAPQSSANPRGMLAPPVPDRNSTSNVRKQIIGFENMEKNKGPKGPKK